MTDPGAQGTIEERIRTAIAFEHLVTSVLFGAFISAGIILVAQATANIFSAQALAPALFSAIFSSVYYAFIVFLTGFLAAIIVGIPLFEFLEKRKMRKAWPYFLAAVLVQLVFYVLVFGKAPVFADLPLITSVSIMAPGLIIAALFTRRMRPLWRRAEHSDHERSSNIASFH